jgi:hypothetical protein
MTRFLDLSLGATDSMNLVTCCLVAWHSLLDISWTHGDKNAPWKARGVSRPKIDLHARENVVQTRCM